MANKKRQIPSKAPMLARAGKAYTKVENKVLKPLALLMILRTLAILKDLITEIADPIF